MTAGRLWEAMLSITCSKEYASSKRESSSWESCRYEVDNPKFWWCVMMYPLGSWHLRGVINNLKSRYSSKYFEDLPWLIILKGATVSDIFDYPLTFVFSKLVVRMTSKIWKEILLTRNLSKTYLGNIWEDSIKPMTLMYVKYLKKY